MTKTSSHNFKMTTPSRHPYIEHSGNSGEFGSVDVNSDIIYHNSSVSPYIIQLFPPRTPSPIYLTPLLVVPPRIVILDLPDEMVCCICYEDVTHRELLTCNHLLCGKCSKNLSKAECPICRRRLEGPSITGEVLTSIRRRMELDQARSLLSKQLIIRLIQRAALSLHTTYRYEFDLMIKHGLSVMHGQDPLEFNTNKKIKDRVCMEFVGLIIESYPNQRPLQDDLFADISAFFTVLDIDM